MWRVWCTMGTGCMRRRSSGDLRTEFFHPWCPKNCGIHPCVFFSTAHFLVHKWVIERIYVDFLLRYLGITVTLWTCRYWFLNGISQLATCGRGVPYNWEKREIYRPKAQREVSICIRAYTLTTNLISTFVYTINALNPTQGSTSITPQKKILPRETYGISAYVSRAYP